MNVTEAPSHRRSPKTRAFAVAALVATLLAGEGLACGYENPQTVALGAMNWAYPKSLYVRTAVWQAEDAGILPPRETTPAKDLFGTGFRQAAASMNSLGALLEDASPHHAGFSIVLIPQVMWTRFSPAGGSIAVETHASGPGPDDTVIVTNDKVVRALLDGTITFEDAEAFGLLRLYGNVVRQAALRTILTRALEHRAKLANVSGGRAERAP
jgi:hypothetical protein